MGRWIEQLLGSCGRGEEGDRGAVGRVQEERKREEQEWKRRELEKLGARKAELVMRSPLACGILSRVLRRQSTVRNERKSYPYQRLNTAVIITIAFPRPALFPSVPDSRELISQLSRCAAHSNPPTPFLSAKNRQQTPPHPPRIRIHIQPDDSKCPAVPLHPPTRKPPSPPSASSRRSSRSNSSTTSARQPSSSSPP